MVRLLEIGCNEPSTNRAEGIFTPQKAYFPGGSLTISPDGQKDRRGFFLDRCRICRCPILQKGAFDLCLGCVNSRTLEIIENGMRKKASVTSFKVSYILSEALSRSGGNTPSKPKVCAPRSILNGRSVNKSLQLIVLGLFLPVLGLTAPARASHNYDFEAKRLAKISCRRARVEVISKTLREIDRNLAKHFPHGPFRREDLIALALGESGFNHREINSRCVGELGIWQVRPEYFRAGDDGLQVSINTAMAFRVLKSKHATAKRIKSPFGLKKTTIICYNGYVRRNGRIDERYWRWFCHNRAKVCKALRVSPHQVPVKYPSTIRDSRMVRKTPHFPVKPRIKFNTELARQLEQDVYGRKI